MHYINSDTHIYFQRRLIKARNVRAREAAGSDSAPRPIGRDGGALPPLAVDAAADARKRPVVAAGGARKRPVVAAAGAVRRTARERECTRRNCIQYTSHAHRLSVQCVAKLQSGHTGGGHTVHITHAQVLYSMCNQTIILSHREGGIGGVVQTYSACTSSRHECRKQQTKRKLI